MRFDVCASGCPFTSVQAAINAATPGATITIGSGRYTGNVTIPSDLTLIGVGDGADEASNTILDAQGSGRVMTIDLGFVSLERLRLTGGNDESGVGGGIRAAAGGTMTMTDCTVTGNTTSDFGGGIRSERVLTMTNCAVIDNEATFGGSGIYNSFGVLTMTECAVVGNTTAGEGGGIRNRGPLTLDQCSVSGNSAGSVGGGIFNLENVTCSNGSTVSDNTVGSPPVANNCVDGPGGNGCASCSA